MRKRQPPLRVFFAPSLILRTLLGHSIRTSMQNLESVAQEMTELLQCRPSVTVIGLVCI